MGISIYLFAMALFFSFLSVWTTIRRANCKAPIIGIFLRFNTHSSKGVKCWFPVFSYTFQGQEYEAQSIDDIPKRKRSEYTPGKVYPLYVNENRPKTVVQKRCPQSAEFLFAAIGLLSWLLFFISMGK